MPKTNVRVPLKFDQNSHPGDYQFGAEVFAYPYILKAVYGLIMPLVVVLLWAVIQQRNYGSVAVLIAIFALNLGVLIVDRSGFSRDFKIRTNGILFKTQVLTMVVFLLVEIFFLSRWELTPWTFVVCYLAFVLINIPVGLITSGIVGTTLLAASKYTATPEIIALDHLMFRFFPAYFLIFIVFICFEYIRCDYSRKLSGANQALSESEENYRRLYEKLANEVHDRKQAEVALLGSEERFRLIAENVADVIWTMDLELKFTYISPSIVRQRGFTVDEAMQQSMGQAVKPDYLERIMMIFTEKMVLIESGREEGFEPIEFEVEQPCKDGSFIWTSNHARILPGSDKKAAGVLGISRDITERRQTEEKLARSKKMESLGLLAGGVAHDLNNILSGIVSYPELLLLDLPADSSLREPIETIKASGDRAAAIVQDLLTVARGVAVAKEPVNLNVIVREYLRSPELIVLEQRYPAVAIDSELADDLFGIIGSLVHLRKVIMNLVTNAAEAVQGEGHVVVATGNRYLDRPLKGYDDVAIGEYAVLSVSDDGPGISAKDLGRIFEPFYTKKVMGRSGTGLGLALVWNAVQDHNGYIDVITDPDGTIFELYFPITREAIAVKDAATSLAAYQGSGERILVVDDEPSQRDISCRMLAALGYAATAVSSGERAVDYLQNRTVDLLLLDMIMEPGINGRETYARIKKIQPHQKAIIVSGYAKIEEVQKTQTLGAGQYIRKPLTLKRLGAAVREELAR